MKKTTKKLIIKKETVSEFVSLSKEQIVGVVGGLESGCSKTNCTLTKDTFLDF